MGFEPIHLAFETSTTADYVIRPSAPNQTRTDTFTGFKPDAILPFGLPEQNKKPRSIGGVKCTNVLT